VASLDPGRVANTVISLTSNGELAEQISRRGVPVFDLGLTKNGSTIGPLLRLVRLLRRLRPDVLQTWLYHADLLGLLAGTIARVPAVAWNVRCAELDPRDHPRRLAPMLRLLAFASGRPAAVVCNSAAGQEVHHSLGYHPRRWILIPNGFDIDVFHPNPDARNELRQELGLSQSTPVVGLLARFHPMKDHGTFCEAAAEVVRLRPDVHFVAAGRGVPANPVVTGMVSRYQLESRMHLLAERRDPARFLAALDVAVSSSYGEAFPNVLGEAMACGTPCVATDVGDSARIVGDAGVVVAARDPGALAAGIAHVLGLDPSSRASLSTLARERIRTEFSLQTMTQRYEQLYFEMTGRREPSIEAPACAG
jgi:glycosyltransferase involved in cell wall biosynthesis